MKCDRFIFWWEGAPWKTFGVTIWRIDCSIWHWLCITPKLRRTNQEFIKWKKSFVLRIHCVRGWEFGRGDVLVADIEELETMDASEVHSTRLNAKKVMFPKQGEFTFPIADGRIKTPGEDQALRTSTLIRPRPNRGEGHIDFLGESEGSLPQPQDSFPDAGEVTNDLWSKSGSFMHHHHVEPRVKLYLPRGTVFFTTEEFGCQAREAHWWLLEHWCQEIVWSLDRSLHPGQFASGQKSGKQWEKNAKLKEKQKWSEEKFRFESARKDKEFKETIKNARKKLETSVAPAVPCKIMKTCGSGSDKNTTKLACILEANESTRMRMGNSEPGPGDGVSKASR